MLFIFIVRSALLTWCILYQESHGTIPKIELLYGNPVNLGEPTKAKKPEDAITKAEVKSEVKAEPGTEDPMEKLLRGIPEQTVQRVTAVSCHGLPATF